MADDVTNLVLAVDARQVNSAAAALDKFAASGKKADSVAGSIEKSAQGAGRAAAGVATFAQATQAKLESVFSRIRAQQNRLQDAAFARADTQESNLNPRSRRVATTAFADQFNSASERAAAAKIKEEEFNRSAAASTKLQLAQGKLASATASASVAQDALNRSQQTAASGLAAATKEAANSTAAVGALGTAYANVNKQVSAGAIAAKLGAAEAERLASFQAKATITTANAAKAQADLAEATKKNAAAQAFLAASAKKTGAPSEAAARIAEKANLALSVATARASAAQVAASNSAARYQRELDAVAKKAGVAASASKLTAQQAQQLSFQLNDFFVQVASGGSALTALIQQGSQLSGTFGGIGAAARAVLSIFSPLRLAIGGAVAAAGALAFGFVAGREESIALQRALTLTGNAAGITEDKYRSLAASISESTNTTIGSTRDTLDGLISSGRISAQALEEAGIAAQLLGKLTGQSSDEIISSFAKAADAPSKFAQEINKTYNFLTAEQFKYIKQLEDQGQSQRALAETLRLLNGRLSEGAKNVSGLSRAFETLKNEASGAADAILGIFRDATPTDQLREINKQIAELQKSGQSAPILFGASLTDLEAQKKALEDQLAQQEAQAQAQAKIVEQENSRLQFGRLLEDSLGTQARLAKELSAAGAIADRAGAAPDDRKAVLDAIRRRFSGSGGRDPFGEESKSLRQRIELVGADTEVEKINAQIKLGNFGKLSAARQEQLRQLASELDARNAINEIDKASLGSDLGRIQRELGGLTSAYTAAGAILEATRQADLIDEREYFESKLALIRLEEAAQIRALEAENARLASQKGSTSELLRNQEQIAQNEARIQALRVDAAAQTEVIGRQQESAIRAVQKATKEAEAAAQSYLDTLVKAQQRELQGLGLGNNERRRLSGRAEIDDRFEEQRQRLASERRTGQIDEARYREELERVRRFQTAALDSYDRYYKSLEQKQGDFLLGAAEATNNYLDETANALERGQRFFDGVFDNAEDALTKFLTTGKLSIKDFGQFIFEELSRATARNALAEGLKFIKGEAGKGGFVDGLGSLLGPLFGSNNPFTTVTGFGGQVDLTKIGADTAATTVPGFAGGRSILARQEPTLQLLRPPPRLRAH
jgi:lambda family phage tail tape measure protein